MLNLKVVTVEELLIEDEVEPPVPVCFIIGEANVN